MQLDYTSTQKNSALCRKDLDFLAGGNNLFQTIHELPNIKFFHVLGATKFWKEEEKFNHTALFGDILNSCARYDVPFCYAIIGNKHGINIYVGTNQVILESLKASYVAAYPGIDIEINPENPLRNAPRSFGGFFTGIPTDKTSPDNESFQIENILRGMRGTNFTYVVMASGISSIAVNFGHEHLLTEMERVYSFINETVSGGAQGNLQAQRQDFQSKNYFENLEALESYLKEGMSRGMWRVNGYYASDNLVDAKRIGSILKSSFSGEESKPQPFRVIEDNSVGRLIENTAMIDDIFEEKAFHPLGEWERSGVPQPISLFVYKYQTLLNSNQLAVLCQLPIKEFPGYYLDEYVEFDVADRTSGLINEPVIIGDICSAGRTNNNSTSNQYSIEKNDFTRHALVIGITGGGKTNTSKYLLSSLWNNKKTPFMVIESAKREYWELRNLKGFEDLMVFTLGSEASETSVRYRINPFETNSAISLQTHIDYLLSTFKAAFELYPPMPYILEKAVYEVYSDRGWDIVENKNRYGLTEYPTLTDLYNKIDVIVDNMGYHQEVQSNVKAALQARIYSLMIGGKGAMLNTSKSVPIQELLSRPVVMELEDLGDDEIKSFVIGILLVQLYEYRKSLMSKGAKDLSHILMIEEAHRLLKKVTESGEGGNTQAKSVEFFCNMLAEIRTFGQGIVIADQIPTKLAADTIKNTNLKIVHRTVAYEDRDTIGKAMNMSDEQIEYLSSLRRGYAAVYAEGDNRPKCVKLPLVTSYYDKTREEVISEAKNKAQKISEGYDEVINHHIGCTYCENRCAYFKKVQEFIDEKIAVDRVNEKWAAQNFSSKAIKRFLKSPLLAPLRSDDLFMNLCIIGYILDNNKALNAGQKQQCLVDYIKSQR